MQREISIDCAGIAGCDPGKKIYLALINDGLVKYNNDTWEKCYTWDECYRLLEPKMKETDPDKDLSYAKKLMQEQGYVRLQDKNFGIGQLVDKD